MSWRHGRYPCIYGEKTGGDGGFSGKSARTFDGDGQMGRNLSREDGLAALQMASAMVCGDCAKCNLYSDSQREDSYYLYYLLRAFEQNGSVGQEDMPRLFQEPAGNRPIMWDS